MKPTSIAIVAVAMCFVTPDMVWSDCPLAHTHIGKNPTWQPDWSDPGNPEGVVDPTSEDDMQLWFFSLPPVHPAGTPGWPDWSMEDGSPFLLLVPEEDPMGNPYYKPGDPSRKRYTCNFVYSREGGYGDPDGTRHLDGWHSAHGPQGAWNLADTGDPETAPSWDIHLQREAASVAEDDFFMGLPGGEAVLTTDGSEYSLVSQWLEDFQAWGIHEHMGFYFWLAADGGDEGSVVSATFSAYDAGGIYDPADSFVFNFRVVPEPATLGLVVLGIAIATGKRRRR